MRYSRYVESICPKDIMIAVYNENVEAKLLIDDIIYEDWNDIGFDSFINTACEEALWEVLDIISDDRDIRKAIENKLFFDESEGKDWEVCPAFASEKDFNNWWYRR